ncbi:hypothetical protein ACVBEQ_24690, partial [Nakamurella sp. GG22]
MDAGEDGGQGEACPDGGVEDGLPGFGGGPVLGGVVGASGGDAQIVGGELPRPAWAGAVPLEGGVGTRCGVVDVVPYVDGGQFGIDSCSMNRALNSLITD